MTPQARIKARFAEEAIALDVQCTVRAQKSTLDGKAYYLEAFGEYDAIQDLVRAVCPGAYMTSGSVGSPLHMSAVTYRLPPEDVEKALIETEIASTSLAWNDFAAERVGVRGIVKESENIPLTPDPSPAKGEGRILGIDVTQDGLARLDQSLQDPLLRTDDAALAMRDRQMEPLIALEERTATRRRF